MSQEKTIRFSFLVQRPSDVDVNVCVYYFLQLVICHQRVNVNTIRAGLIHDTITETHRHTS